MKITQTLQSQHFWTQGLAIAKVIRKVKSLVSSISAKSSEESSEEETNSKPADKYDFWHQHKELVHGKTKNMNVGDESEVTMYMNNPVSKLKENPLETWEDMKTIFPGSYQLAKKYLMQMATSVPSERLFSKAGATITQ